ncbi:MAG: hypothetical protein ACOX0L_04235 [Natronincolaceae bacterium]|jgi:hypothetical protein|nr:hypothetical protein [Bacillota bacterium]NLK90232.1 hypothetical protein [Clostridiales bacterium]
MNRATYKNVKGKMAKALTLIKEALDISISMLRTNQENNIAMLWEEFMREIILYIRHKSRETGINFSNYISMRRIFFK